MDKLDQILDVASGNRELRVSIERKDVLMLSAGVFVAMFLAMCLALITVKR